MKKMKKIAALAFALMLIFSLCVSVFAENTSSYTVRLYGGDGTVGILTVGNGSVYSLTVPSGGSVSFSADQVKVVDDRFYAKGFREAGHDNNPVYTFGTSIAVTRDIDFVVAYGMKSTAVTYTVRYQHATTGADLLAAQTFYGNVGDKPVVAFLYIEGYMPQAYNLTKTLSADESQNELVFRYEPIPQGGGAAVVPVNPGGNQGGNQGANQGGNQGANQGGNQGANQGGNQGANQGANQGGNQGANQGANQGGATGENQGANQGGATGENQGANQGGATGENQGANQGGATGENQGGSQGGATGENQGGTEPGTTVPAQPEEIIDLDVPQAGPGSQSETEGNAFSKLPVLVKIIGGLILAGLIATPIAFLVTKKKKEDKKGQ